MANGFSRVRGLSDMYVYYEHLSQTYPELHSKLKGDLNSTAFSLGSGNSKNGQNLLQTAGRLKEMAKVERQKEQNFINHTFGQSINLNIDDVEDFKNFVEVFNKTMQLEQVYQANKTLILTDTVSRKKNEKTGEIEHNEITNKNAYTYFSDYFARTFVHGNRLNKMARKVADIIQNNPNTSLEEVVRKVVDEEIPVVVEVALTKLEKVGGLSKVKNIEGYTKEEDEMAIKGYREIAKAINSMGKNAFGQMIIKELGLQNSIDKVIEGLKTTGINTNQLDMKNFKKAMLQGTRYFRSEGKNILGGNMLELVENAVINQMGKIKGKNIYAVHTGGTLAKPDNLIASINIDMQQMEHIWKDAFKSVENKAVSRQRNIQAAENLQRTLEGINAQGYILYSSAKNQTLQSATFKTGGFNSGTPMGIKELQTVMEKVPYGNGAGLARAVMQTLGPGQGKGAIGESERERLQTEIASYLAYFLFDDFQTIGNEIANSSQNKINCLHAMYLNGVYVPMSVLLNLLANAFQTTAKDNINQIAKVNIKKIKIKYDYENNPPQIPSGETSMALWQAQRDEAQANLKITVRFLKSFKQLMSSLKANKI